MTHNLAQELRHRGHEIFVITTTRAKSEEGEEELDSLKIFRIYSDYHERWRSWRGLINLPITAKLKKIIKKIKPDIVHSHNIHDHLSYKSLKIAKKYSRAVFLTAHDVMLVNYGKLMPKNGKFLYKISVRDQIKQAQKRYNPFRGIIIRHYLRYTDKIFAVSNALKEVLETNGIKNIQTIYNGIDIDNWNVELNEIEKFKKENNLADKR